MPERGMPEGEMTYPLYKKTAAAPARSPRFNKNTILIGAAIFILFLSSVFVSLYLGRAIRGAITSVLGGSDSESSDSESSDSKSSNKECILPANMKWKPDIKRRKVGDSTSITEITSEAVCIDPDFIPSPSKGHIYCPPTTSGNPPLDARNYYVGITKDNNTRYQPPYCPTPKEPCPTPANADWLDPNAVKKSIVVNIPSEETTRIIRCHDNSVPSPSRGPFLGCSDGIAKVLENKDDKDGTVITCPSPKEGYANYLGELLDWISGRPDINQQSKYSLLPGYFN